MTEFKPVVFKVGNENYGVDINMVRGIEKVIQVVPIPNSNKNIKGIINLRGEVVPIYSLRAKFNLEEAVYTEDTKFILVKVDDILFALEVDKVDDVQNITDGILSEVPVIVKSRDTDYLDKIISANDKIILVINLHNLMTGLEMKQLSDMVKDMA